MAKFSTFVSWCKKLWNNLKKRANDGKKWIGVDGLLNMETAALIEIFLMIFFPTMWAMFFAATIMVGKCAFDKTKGHENELHDLICAIIGVMIGAILGPAQAAITLF